MPFPIQINQAGGDLNYVWLSHSPFLAPQLVRSTFSWCAPILTSCSFSVKKILNLMQQNQPNGVEELTFGFDILI